MSILCDQGYIIPKNEITEQQLKQIKSDLKVKPFVRGARARFTKSFKMHLEYHVMPCTECQSRYCDTEEKPQVCVDHCDPTS